MKALIILNSFKGCLTSGEACEAVRKALTRFGLPESDIICVPSSDGGEGFCETLMPIVGGRSAESSSRDALLRPLKATYRIAGSTAVIESASVLGFGSIPLAFRNPALLTSCGLADLIRSAISCGAEDILLGLGGTCTCDGGAGLLQGLGIRFYDRDREWPEGEPLLMKPISRIDAQRIVKLPAIRCICDTNAPFSGERGAVWTFAAQKGLPKSFFGEADAWMQSLAALYASAGGREIDSLNGAGAAGGIAGALASLAGAQIVCGSTFVLEAAGIPALLSSGQFDMVVTGEGSLDSQTPGGKLPYEVLRLARQCDVPNVVCVAGRADGNIGFDDVVCTTPSSLIGPDGMPLASALERSVAAANISDSFYAYLQRKYGAGPN